jgi:hypothetical protein
MPIAILAGYGSVGLGVGYVDDELVVNEKTEVEEGTKVYVIPKVGSAF